MIDLELPLGKRTHAYRFFEMLPAILSYGAILLLIVLSFVNALWAAAYLLLVVMTMFVRSVIVAYHTIRGHNELVAAQKVDWHERLESLERPADSFAAIRGRRSREFGFIRHVDNLRLIAADEDAYPRPSQLYHAVIVAAYNEGYDVIQPTVQSVADTSFPNDKIIFVLTYEQRGGPEIAATAKRLQKDYAGVFHEFLVVEHPDGLPDELPSGKGPNITYAGRALQAWCDDQGLSYKDVIVTTLDSDNRPHKGYFDYVAYEYIVQPNRKRLSYQPIALYFGNIWDAPAPMRVIATGNSFWTIISSMRPHTLRNFAAHSQPLDALTEMGFWSKRSIVEDGHQYWRSYFYFGGDYSVLPIHLPVYQDAVMADTLMKTLVAQFKQLRRWSYGASDVPYVAVRVLSGRRNVPLGEGLARLIRLIDSHVSLASMAILVAFGGWAPLLINPEAARNITAHALPVVVSYVQQIAMIGIFITILLMMKMLPPRPLRYKRRRTVFMVLQWVLMPITSICYGSIAAYNAQTHLLFGKYLDKFDITEKATLASRAAAKQQRQSSVKK